MLETKTAWSISSRPSIPFKAELDTLSYEELTSDKLLFGGVVYYTMVIGEAAYKLSRPFVARYQDVEWDVIANMRHHLVHGYYQVNAKDVWDVLQNDLTPLREQIAHLLETIDWEEWK
ncbi:MAG: DUF86 domain-containing protein [Prevotella sp.]|nr:DUF86 domain-containing protein [Prevotella sp.]